LTITAIDAENTDILKDKDNVVFGKLKIVSTA
jgi:hypothetical protein